MTTSEDSRPVETVRLDAFVDAAFAFAVTLLIIAGAEPLTGMDSLVRALGRIPSFAAGFLMVIVFWIGHREYGRHTPHRDAWSTVLSLAIVFVVLIFVFPLRLLTESGMAFFSGGRLPGANLIHSLADLRDAFIIYGLGVAVLGGLYVLLASHGRKLARADGDAAADVALRDWRDAWTVVALSGLGSSLMAPLILHGLWPGTPGFFYWFIPLGIFMIGWLRRRGASNEAAAEVSNPVDGGSHEPKPHHPDPGAGRRRRHGGADGARAIRRPPSKG